MDKHWSISDGTKLEEGDMLRFVKNGTMLSAFGSLEGLREMSPKNGEVFKFTVIRNNNDLEVQANFHDKKNT